MATVRGDVKIMSTLTRWAQRAGNSEPAMLAILDYMEEREARLFESEGNSAGRPWTPITDATIREREESQQFSGALAGHKVLQSTQALINSLTKREDENAIRLVGPGFVQFGTKLDYAGPHQKGFTDRAGHRVPARRPIDWTRRDRYVVSRLLGSWITGNPRKVAKPSLKLLAIG